MKNDRFDAVDWNHCPFVVFVYGRTDDAFCDQGLHYDNFETALWRYLKGVGFECILFFDGRKRLYSMDQKSWSLAKGSKDKSTHFESTKFRLRGPGSPEPDRNSSDLSMPGQEEKSEELGEFLVVDNDPAMIRIVSGLISGATSRTAVVFSQFLITSLLPESRETLFSNIDKWHKDTTLDGIGSKIIMVYNVNSQSELINALEPHPMLKSLVSDGSSKVGSFANLLPIPLPSPHEVANFLHYYRIVNGAEVVWQEFSILVKRMVMERRTLRDWAGMFRNARVNLMSAQTVPKLLGCEVDEVGTAMSRLKSLIGLKNVKEILNRILRRASLPVVPGEKRRLHMVFKGGPGTGKTVVARLLGEILKDNGVLKFGHFVETDRGGLVGSYIGHTAEKTTAIIDKAVGGVLFIDEAYQLGIVGGNDFGSEAIATLIKRMEDDSDKLVVILAGYSDAMDGLYEANDGFQSRVTEIHFDDYDGDELYEIFERNCLLRRSLVVSHSAEVKLRELLWRLYEHRDRTFSNARMVEELFDKKIYENFLDRCERDGKDPSVEPIAEDDIP